MSGRTTQRRKKTAAKKVKELTYGQKVQQVLAQLGVDAVRLNDRHLNTLVPGLTELSVSAHELNILIKAISESNGINNLGVLKQLAMVCARLIKFHEENIARQQEEAEKRAKEEAEKKEAADNEGEDKTD